MAPNPKHKLTRQNKGDSSSQQQQRSLESYIPSYLRTLLVPYHDDFCYTTFFHPRLVAQLMMEGFLPIATEGILLPKLHQQRCVIRLPQNLHISKSTRKKAKRFQVSINQAFQDVVAGCRQQHGRHCWLYPPLVRAFETIHQAGDYETAIIITNNGSTTGQQQQHRCCKVRLYSIEIWNAETGTLVGGELGYTVGTIYTSLTGFAAQDSAGSVQLAALGKLLCQQGFTLWDLGMEMEYKRNLGSELMSRQDFVNTVHRVRECNDIRLPVHFGRVNAKSIIIDTNKDNVTAMTPQVPPTTNEREESPSAAKKARRSTQSKKLEPLL